MTIGPCHAMGSLIFLPAKSIAETALERAVSSNVRLASSVASRSATWLIRTGAVLRSASPSYTKSMHVSMPAGMSYVSVLLGDSSKSTICTNCLVLNWPVRPSENGPASRRALTPGDSSTCGIVTGSSVPYDGSSILCLAGTLSQIWKPSSISPALLAPPSACSIPLPQLIHCMPGAGNSSRLPIESPWRPVPRLRYVMMSMPRCGCQPMGKSSGWAARPSLSMMRWSHMRNGSLSADGMPIGKAWMTERSSPKGWATPASTTRIVRIVVTMLVSAKWRFGNCVSGRGRHIPSWSNLRPKDPMILVFE
ncbi:hypothetical protein SPRG_18822, partial [Saprolegnia parasitica CBS 223.65]